MVPPALCRLGYILLYMDSDSILFDDPYRFFKSPPLDKINFLTMPESDCGIQASFFYVQNARPDGPASWIFKVCSHLLCVDTCLHQNQAPAPEP